MKRYQVALFAALFAWSALTAAAPVDDAKELFERWVQLGEAFDPAISDLYSDTARIVNKRTYPTGEVRELTIPGQQYKALLRQAMPLAKARETQIPIRRLLTSKRVRASESRRRDFRI